MVAINVIKMSSHMLMLTSTQLLEHQVEAGTIFKELDEFQDIPDRNKMTQDQRWSVFIGTL